MGDQNIPPVYSYLKFKELADDRMSQVRIYVQNSDEWESSGSGMLHFFQITPNNMMKEIISLADYDVSIKNLYMLIETSESQTFSEQEYSNLKKNHSILNSKILKINNLIAVYDLYNGSDFDNDIESYFKRKSNHLDSQEGGLPPPGDQFRVRWHFHKNVGVFVQS